MSRRTPFAAPLLAAALLAGGCSDPGAARRPDVVLVVVDTLRADAIADPAGRVDTPNIDALAADGVVFPNAFSHAPITLPSHTALFSSRPPFETGVTNNGQEVDEHLPLLAEWMSDHGYATRAVISLGTLHIGGKSSVERGFDRYDVGFWRMDQGDEVMTRVGPHLDALAGSRPFFLFAHFSDPHEPYNAHGTVRHEARVRLDGDELATLGTSDMSLWKHPLELPPGAHELVVESEDEFVVRWAGVVVDERELPSEWLEADRLQPTKTARIRIRQASEAPVQAELRLWINDVVPQAERVARYRLEVEYVDRWVGLLIDELKARGLYEDTLIVFTSDHGEALGERGHMGHIQSVYDEQIHVPLIVKGPASDPRSAELARHGDELAPLVDVTPTILELAGIPPLPDQRGKSLLQGGSGILVAETHAPQAKRDSVCMRDDRFKLIYDPEDDRFELYDLREDPGETRDVWAERGGERREWEQQLRHVAAIAQAGGMNLEDLDEDVQRDLKSLGY